MGKPFDGDRQDHRGLESISHIACLTIRQLLASGELASKKLERDNRLFLFIQRGGGYALVGSEQYALEPGAFLVIPANCLYQLRLEAETDGFCFSGSELFLRTWVAEALISTPAAFWLTCCHTVVHYGLVGCRLRLERVFAAMALAVRRFGLGCDAAVIGYILVLITESNLSEAADDVTDIRANNSSSTGLLSRYQLLVETHFRKHHSIEHYCRALGVNRAQLIEVCKRIAKSTPLELVHRRMLLEATTDRKSVV